MRINLRFERLQFGFADQGFILALFLDFFLQAFVIIHGIKEYQINRVHDIAGKYFGGYAFIQKIVFIAHKRQKDVVTDVYPDGAKNGGSNEVKENQPQCGYFFEAVVPDAVPDTRSKQGIKHEIGGGVEQRENPGHVVPEYLKHHVD
jgi:hypothetical protein